MPYCLEEISNPCTLADLWTALQGAWVQYPPALLQTLLSPCHVVLRHFCTVRGGPLGYYAGVRVSLVLQYIEEQIAYVYLCTHIADIRKSQDLTALSKLFVLSHNFLQLLHIVISLIINSILC